MWECWLRCCSAAAHRRRRMFLLPEEENTEWVYVEKTELNDVELQDEVVCPGEHTGSFVHAGAGGIGNVGCQNNQAQIDYSNTADGYVMVRYTASTTKRLKVQVKGPTTTYTYNITPGDTWTTFPLSDGNRNLSGWWCMKIRPVPNMPLCCPSLFR